MLIDKKNILFNELIEKVKGIQQVPPFDLQFTIEAYPRTANSFAASTLIPLMIKSGDLQRRGVVFHHTHRVDTVLFSLAMEVPTLSVLRSPSNAVCSAYSFYEGKFDFDALLTRWIKFYAPLLELSDIAKSDLLLVHFDEITQRPNCVINKLNEKFSFNLDQIDDIESHTNQVFQNALERSKAVHGRHGYKNKVGIPNQDRSKSYKSHLEMITNEPKYDHCNNLFSDLISMYDLS